MLMDLTTVKFDRKTGKEICRWKSGTKEIPDDELAEGYCLLLTGMTTQEVVAKMREEEMKKRSQ